MERLIKPRHESGARSTRSTAAETPQPREEERTGAGRLARAQSETLPSALSVGWMASGSHREPL